MTILEKLTPSYDITVSLLDPGTTVLVPIKVPGVNTMARGASLVHQVNSTPGAPRVWVYKVIASQ